MFKNILLIGQAICFVLIVLFSIEGILHRESGEIAGYTRVYQFAMIFIPYFILLILSTFFRINWSVTIINYVFFAGIFWLALHI